MKSVTRYIDEESEWSGSHGPEVQRGFSQGWALPQLSFTAGLRRMLRRLLGHLAAYLPGLPEGLVHCRLLPHTGPGRLSTICLGHSVAGVAFLSSPQHPSRVLWNILSLSPPQAEEKELPRGCAHLPPRPPPPEQPSAATASRHNCPDCCNSEQQPAPALTALFQMSLSRAGAHGPQDRWGRAHGPLCRS